MKKLQTFLIYILIIVGFFCVSEFLSGQLLNQMYRQLNGLVEEEFEYNGEKTALGVDIIDAKASNVNGRLTAKVTNNTDNYIDTAYLKMDLYDKNGNKAVSRYLEVNDLQPGESKDYTLKFKAGYVDKYKVAVKEDFPDKDYTFDIFGYEINTRNIFGIDVSKYVDANKLKDVGTNGISSLFGFFGKVGHRFVVTAKSVPWWGYAGAFAIIAGII